MSEGAPKPKSEKPAGFLDKTISRRNLLKLGVAAGAAYALKDWKDFEKEELAQYEVPPRLKEVFELMEILDIKLPKDALYGFTFPSTKEMAAKFKEVLKKRVGNPPVTALIVVQERGPKTISGSIKHLNRGITAPRISRAKSLNAPAFLYLPDYLEKKPAIEVLISAYHEGYHLFYQVTPGHTPQDRFNDENSACIADILLQKQIDLLRKDAIFSKGRQVKVYDDAVAKNDKTIWEKDLKQLYKLPEDCCVNPPIPTKP